MDQPVDFVGVSKEDQEKMFEHGAKQIEKLEDEWLLNNIDKFKKRNNK